MENVDAEEIWFALVVLEYDDEREDVKFFSRGKKFGDW